MNAETKCWDIYGKVTYIGPYRRYHIKTSSGRVLVRNRRFLRRRVPLSVPNTNTQHESPQQPMGDTEQVLNTPQRPTCQRHRTKKLHEKFQLLCQVIANTKAWWGGVGNWN